MSKNAILLGIVGSILTGFCLLLSGMFFTSVDEIAVHPDYAMAATSSAVTVSAAVSAAISCSTDVAATDFGTWTDTSIKTSTPNASSTMACANSSGGCTLYVKDAGGGGNPGLYKNPDLIESPDALYNATATLVAGTEGYGIQAATNTAGSGAALGIPARYFQTGNTVGGLLITNTAIANTTATTSGREVIVTHKAAVGATTPSGSYSDTITYECTQN